MHVQDASKHQAGQIWAPCRTNLDTMHVLDIRTSGGRFSRKSVVATACWFLGQHAVPNVVSDLAPEVPGQDSRVRFFAR